MISNLGRVKSNEGYVYRKGYSPVWHEERILKHGKCENFYPGVALCSNGKVKHYKVHNLMRISFIGKKDLAIQ